MSRSKIVLLALVLLIGALAVWLYRRSNAPPEVPFTNVRRERLVSTLVTNGKVEPSLWAAARAERAGLAEKVNVDRGTRVAAAAILVELESRDARAQLISAEAEVAKARAELETVKQGGRSSARVEIENALTRAQLDLDEARRNHETLSRLAAKNASTRREVETARQRVEQIEGEIKALERKRGALVAEADRTAAEAALKEAEARLAQARLALDRSVIRSPMAGIVYELGVRPGAYVNVGDAVAHVGELSTVRVRLFVDEPELGRVKEGMPVTITWDALAGRKWEGAVEKTPTQVVALGTRQVGEVICTIANSGLDLLPGTNVNAEIQSQVVENGLTIPKEAVRRENNQTGVFVLEDSRVRWRAITLGASSLTRAAVLQGLSEGDQVALASDRQLADGQAVRPVLR